MEDITDAAEASRTILMGLNRDWLKKQGDFFVESPINFLTAVIWFLARYENGKYCTLPHAIELMQLGYRELFALLDMQEEVRVLIPGCRSHRSGSVRWSLAMAFGMWA